MNENFFNSCKSLEELEAKFEDLKRTFGIDYMPEYVEFKQRFMQEFKAKKDSMTSKPQNAPYGAQTTSRDEILSYLHRNNIQAEKIGKWYWVSRNGVNGHEADLKRLGFRFSQSKQCWYWRADEDRSSNPNPLPIDAIRKKYGSQAIGQYK